MKGIYCLLIRLASDQSIAIGALGKVEFEQGCYVYVGSAMGGIEQRVGRHKSSRKKLRWHIDYFLEKAEVLACVAIQSETSRTECETVEALSSDEHASFPVPRFGSSGCRCRAHLIYFGDEDPTSVAESLNMHLSMLRSAYPRTMG